MKVASLCLASPKPLAKALQLAVQNLLLGVMDWTARPGLPIMALTKVLMSLGVSGGRG